MDNFIDLGNNVLFEAFQAIWDFIAEKLDVSQWLHLEGLWSYIGYFFPEDIILVLQTLLVIYIILAIKSLVFK